MIRILLADDLGMMLHLLTGLCNSDGGFEVVGAVETGEEAIELALRIKPDVMVLDIKLPGRKLRPRPTGLSSQESV